MAAAQGVKTSGNGLEGMSLEELDAQLQQLGALKHAHHAATPSSLTTRLFATLFPGSPAVNALLATLYISGPPNLLLALCPADIDPGSLSVMVAFAVGGLLGDTLFHLLPEIFLGEDEPGRVRLVLVEGNRNLVLGMGILVGFMVFVALDKGLRIATGGGGGGDAGAGGHHHHGHGHDDGAGRVGVGEATAAVVATGVQQQQEQQEQEQQQQQGGGEVGARKRGKKKEAVVVKTGTTDMEMEREEKKKELNASAKLGGYLNL
ncbi:hypothetical protein E4U41_003487, partial [Claviceps citrina]